MMKRKFNEGKGAQNPEQKRPRSQSGYIGDPRLVPRVRQVSTSASCFPKTYLCCNILYGATVRSSAARITYILHHCQLSDIFPF